MDNGEKPRQDIIRIYTPATEYTVEAGKSLEIAIDLVNLGESGAFINLEVRNIPPTWVTLLPMQMVYLDPGKTVHFNLTLAPPADTVGSREFRLVACKQNEPEPLGEAKLTLQVKDPGTEGGVELLAEKGELSLSPGEHATMHAKLRNGGHSSDIYMLSVHGPCKGWVRIEPSQIALASGEETELQINILAPEYPVAQVGDYPVSIQARSQEASGVSVQLDFVLSVAAFRSDSRIGVKLGAVRFYVNPGETCSIPVQLTNQGLDSDDFTLSLESEELPTGWVSIDLARVTLARGQQKMLNVKIFPPKKSSSRAKPYRFSLKVQSRLDPEQSVQVDCVINLTAFHRYSVQVAPRQVFAGQPIRVTAENNGNTSETFVIHFTEKDPEELNFTVLPATPVMVTPNAPTQAVSVTQVHTLSKPGVSEVLRVDPGKLDSVQFIATSKRPPLFGRSKLNKFETKVIGPDHEEQVFPCAVTTKPMIPFGAIVAFFLLCLVSLCAVIWLVGQGGEQNATQTAAVETQASIAKTGIALATQTAIAVQVDSDGDGLLDSVELSIGTNPGVVDTDLDGLADGDEVNTHKTDPLIADSDEDGLVDGDEVTRGTNPLSSDSDADGLKDGDEIRLGTDPKSMDTDGDGLIDSEEVVTCTRPVNPDTDQDGIRDDEDLDPCDAQNPALTATAQALIPTATITLTPTSIPTVEPPTPTPTPTQTATAVVPSLPGSLLFASNWEGRFQIYHRVLNTDVITRLTISNGDDTEPAWSPDGSRVAFTSNRDGNQEIYVMDADGANQVNLTADPARDRHPTWSPDGEWLAFSSDREGNDEIYIMRRDGSEVQNISNHPDSDTQPYWGSTSGINSVSGMILFVTDRDGNQEIYRMNPQGEFLVNLTNHEAPDYQPAFSLGSQRIAFVSERDGSADIYVMDSDGSSLLNLSANATSNEYAPSWSRDGLWIICSVRTAGGYDLQAILSDGSLRYNVIVTQGDDLDPAWR